MEISELSPIGIGTYNIDLNNKNYTLKSLEYSVNKGQNFMSTALVYEDGKVVDFLCEFFKRIKRDKFFLTCYLERFINKAPDVEKQVDKYLSKIKTDYIDNLQVHASYVSKIPLMDTYYEINRLVEKGKVQHISACNINLEELKNLKNNFNIVSFEGIYNLECKFYENISLIDYCRKAKIQFICYQALRKNKISIKNYPFLLEMSNKYKKTQNQILINWLIKEKKLKVLIKSLNTKNIDENWESQNFDLESSDVDKLEKFYHNDFNKISIDWKDQGGILIDQLSDCFE